MPFKRAVLFVNGELIDPKRVLSMLNDGDFMVAVDGGLRHLMMLKIVPHLLLGDLDSISRDDVERMQTAGVAIKRYPVQKDETDLELALQYVVSEGYRTIAIVAALGGRLDQTLANIFLLASPRLEGCDARLVDGREEVFLIRKQSEITGCMGDIISLLPLHEVVEAVTTEGLQYPLREESLFPDRTRAISNVMLSNRATISIRTGMLLCIHTNQL